MHSSSDVRLKLCSSGVLAAVFELRQEPLCKLYQPRGPQTNSEPEVRIGLVAGFLILVCYLFSKLTRYSRVYSACNNTLRCSIARLRSPTFRLLAAIEAAATERWKRLVLEEKWRRLHLKSIIFIVFVLIPR